MGGGKENEINKGKVNGLEKRERERLKKKEKGRKRRARERKGWRL